MTILSLFRKLYFASIFLLICQYGYGQTFTWTGASVLNDNWENAGNWDCGGCGIYPNADNHNIIIGVGANITITGTPDLVIDINQLTMTGGTIDVQGFTLHADNTVSITGGTIIGDAGSTVTFDTNGNSIIISNTSISTDNVNIAVNGNNQRVDIDGDVTLGRTANVSTIEIINGGTAGGDDVTWTTNLTLNGNTTITHQGNQNIDDFVINADDIAFPVLTANGNLEVNNNSTVNFASIEIANIANSTVDINGNLVLNSSDSGITINAPANNTSTTDISGTFSGSGDFSNLELNYVTVNTAIVDMGTFNVGSTGFEAIGSTLRGDITVNSTNDIQIGETGVTTQIIGENISLSAGTNGSADIDGTVILGDTPSGSGVINITSGNDPVSWNTDLTLNGDATITVEANQNVDALIILSNNNNNLLVDGDLTVNNFTTVANQGPGVLIANADNTDVEVRGNLEINSTRGEILINDTNNPNSTTTVAGTFSGSGTFDELNLNYVTVSTPISDIGTFNVRSGGFKAEASTLLGSIEVNSEGHINIDNTDIIGEDISLVITTTSNYIDIDGDVTLGNGTGDITITSTHHPGNNQSYTWGAGTTTITLDGNATITAAGNNGGDDFIILDDANDEFIVTGDVTFNANGTNGGATILPSNDGAFEFGGDVNLNSTIHNRSYTFGNVLLNGNGNHLLTTSGLSSSPVFENLEINKTGTFTLNDDLIIEDNGTTTFTNGIINSDASTTGNILIINDDVTVTGASDASHVDGYIRKIGDDAFTFPLGSDGVYLPLSISDPGTNANDVFDSRAIQENPIPAGFNNFFTIGALEFASGCERYELQGTQNVNVTLSWKEYNDVTDCSGVDPNFLGDLRIARWSDSGSIGWEETGTVASTSVVTSAAPFLGNTPISTGSITSTLAYSSGNGLEILALGSTTLNHALPVELLSFKAEVTEKGKVLIYWESAVELGFDRYEIERSPDGIIFNQIAIQKGAEQNTYTRQKYEQIDTQPLDGISYYRLKMIDLDGTFEFSSVEFINYQSSSEFDNINLSIYPNPSSDYITVDLGTTINEATWKVIDTHGRLIEENQVSEAYKLQLDITTYKAGIYIFYLSMRGQVSAHKIIKK